MPNSDGLLVVISGPAGSGKNTLVQNLIIDHPVNARRAITATTRPPRPGEQHEVDYYFLKREEFLDLIEKDEFLEHTEFNGNLYGTPRQSLNHELTKGGVIILIIEVEGAESVKHQYPDALFIFIIPPTPAELRRRLEYRGTESKQDIENRLAIARHEMKHIDNYDFFVINDAISAATHDLAAIIRAVHRCLITGDELKSWDEGRFSDWKSRHLL